ncbi:hypothetical protein D0U04_11895 [Bacillus clarus]|uniref:Putative membrane protein n=1 Tax=Bacillus clarus TaxID=2338372 RepID=A0A090YQ90_9BACI|nr:hypothetical protein [Bacillus clarus]KFN00999.1 putative membrane protein [Bacillus clarus]RFT66879.1 hypothetical protein D0U04_11895 [Bacillus clarus]
MNKTSTFSYILTKLTATCLLFLLIASFVLSTASKQTMYSFLNGLHELLFAPWTVILASYAIFCSVCIDNVNFKQQNTMKKLCLYILCGYLFFLPFQVFQGTGLRPLLFAGSIGAICSVFFYLCTVIAKRFKWLQYLVPSIMLITFISINFVDVTQKEQWKENRTKHSFEASFQHFSGEHKIPIELKRGDILEFTIESPSETPDAYIEDVKMASEFQEEEKYLALTDHNTYQFAAVKTGKHYIVINGNNLKGKLQVNWNIK